MKVDIDETYHLPSADAMHTFGDLLVSLSVFVDP